MKASCPPPSEKGMKASCPPFIKFFFADFFFLFFFGVVFFKVYTHPSFHFPLTPIHFLLFSWGKAKKKESSKGNLNEDCPTLQKK
jgi:hypothetical protein